MLCWYTQAHKLQSALVYPNIWDLGNLGLDTVLHVHVLVYLAAIKFGEFTIF